MHASPSTTPAPLHDASPNLKDNVEISSPLPDAVPDVVPDVAAADVDMDNATDDLDAGTVEPISTGDVAIAEARSVTLSQPNGLDARGDIHMADSGTDAEADVDVKPNGVHPNGDLSTPSVEQLALQTPELNTVDASPSDTTVVVHPPPDDADDGDKPPPAKRARRLSDPEQASLVHVSILIFLQLIRCSFDQVQRCQWRRPSPIRILPPFRYPTPRHLQSAAAQVLSFHRPPPQKGQGCRPIPTSCRLYCLGHPALCQRHQASDGLVHRREKDPVLKPQ